MDEACPVTEVSGYAEGVAVVPWAIKVARAADPAESGVHREEGIFREDAFGGIDDDGEGEVAECHIGIACRLKNIVARLLRRKNQWFLAVFGPCAFENDVAMPVLHGVAEVREDAVDFEDVFVFFKEDG